MATVDRADRMLAAVEADGSASPFRPMRTDGPAKAGLIG